MTQKKKIKYLTRITLEEIRADPDWCVVGLNGGILCIKKENRAGNGAVLISAGEHDTIRLLRLSEKIGMIKPDLVTVLNFPSRIKSRLRQVAIWPSYYGMFATDGRLVYKLPQQVEFNMD